MKAERNGSCRILPDLTINGIPWYAHTARPEIPVGRVRVLAGDLLSAPAYTENSLGIEYGTMKVVCPKDAAHPLTPRGECEQCNVMAIAIDGETPAVGRKDDAEKPRYDLVQFRAFAAVVRVLTFGAKKYAPENWRIVPEPRRRYYAAALRHLIDWFLGEKNDPQSGESHLAHAICCLNFLLELELEKVDG